MSFDETVVTVGNVIPAISNTKFIMASNGANLEK